MDAPVPAEPVTPALDYQTPGTQRPPRTRVQVVALPGGATRYTDPAATWRDLLPEILHAVLSIPFMLVVSGVLVHGLRIHGGARRLAIGAIGGLTVWILVDLWREVRRRRRGCTTIEAAAGRLKLWHPTHGYREWPLAEISALHGVRD